MYLGLFLTPWLLMYALSTVVFNHYQRISAWYGGNMESRFEPEKILPYHPTFRPDATPRRKAEHILRDLNLSGSFGVNETEDNHLVIDRRDPMSPRRITYYPDEKKLVVERKAFRFAQFLTTVHSQVSYTNSLKRIKLWAASVDLTALATILLTLSGFWMWWELKATRLWGIICAALGFGLFAAFLVYA